ncbi:MAG TPA: metallophosphoesterase [Pyrinomonadaceae bacterium]|jgi:UDP-2,3-diacylglucosamine pyrophosphatase LpxH
MRRLIIISDLHIGGDEYPMLGHPEKLVNFLNELADYRPPPKQTIELVINGDFVDFLAQAPFKAWTEDQSSAISKLEAAMTRFPSVFAALARCAQKLSGLTLVLGNHDVEMALPKVRERFLKELQTDTRRCTFIITNEAYSIGDLLIEHGNRYDGWNAIDHDGLRHTVSWASRGEPPLAKENMKICPGSQFVIEVMNPLKARYYFIDLLKPETKIVTLLIRAFEPALKYDLKVIYEAAQTYVGQWARTRPWLQTPFPQPGQVEYVKRMEEMSASFPDDLRERFAEELRPVYPNLQQTGLLSDFASALKKRFLRPLRPDSLRTRLERGEKIPAGQLRDIQVALKHVLYNDRSFEFDEVDGPYVSAAKRMTQAGVAKVVVMGHTHLAKNIDLGPGLKYVNTGTWADVIRVPMEYLENTGEGLAGLEKWLESLVLNKIDSLRDSQPTYADVLVDENGNVANSDNQPLLRSYEGKGLSEL